MEKKKSNVIHIEGRLSKDEIDDPLSAVIKKVDDAIIGLFDSTSEQILSLSVLQGLVGILRGNRHDKILNKLKALISKLRGTVLELFGEYYRVDISADLLDIYPQEELKHAIEALEMIRDKSQFFDDDGYLVDIGKWDLSVARQIAAQESVSPPWLLVHNNAVIFVNQAYCDKGKIPTYEEIAKEAGVEPYQLANYFPGNSQTRGGVNMIAKAAGLPNPKNR